MEGDTGLIIFDPLISIETAKAALELYYQHRPRKPVVAVVHSHSHVDHYCRVKPEGLVYGAVRVACHTSRRRRNADDTCCSVWVDNQLVARWRTTDCQYRRCERNRSAGLGHLHHATRWHRYRSNSEYKPPDGTSSLAASAVRFSRINRWRVFAARQRGGSRRSAPLFVSDSRIELRPGTGRARAARGRAAPRRRRGCRRQSTGARVCVHRHIRVRCGCAD
ncbi:MAG: MBL fold metallo-hydrolase [Anaerolineae bacterium]